MSRYISSAQPCFYRNIRRGLDNYEMNTETMHPFSVKRSESGLGRRGVILPLSYQHSSWIAEISIGTPPKTLNGTFSLYHSDIYLFTLIYVTVEICTASA
jgi:hypothetical protein